nr:hypothetical protein [uncultured bacterium]
MKGTEMTDTNKALKDMVAELSMDIARKSEKMDFGALSNLLHDDYTAINFDGRMHDKQDRLAEWRNQEFKPSSVKIQDIKVRPLGDTVVVTGICSVKASYKGEDMSADYRFSQTFKHKDSVALSATTKREDLLLWHSTATKVV